LLILFPKNLCFDLIKANKILHILNIIKVLVIINIEIRYSLIV
jgi:hypothetical protein